MSRNVERAPIVAVVASVAAYAGTLRGSFVYDDVQNVLQNPWLTRFGYLGRIFSSDAAGFDPRFATSYYRPLMHVLYLVVYQLFGPRAWAFHALNIALHATATWLAWHVVQRLASRDPRFAASAGNVAFVAALIFAVHPVHTESVAWLAGITDLSYTVLALLALAAYLRESTWPAAVLFLAACLCKEPAVMLIPILVLIEYSSRGANDRARTALARLAPFGAALGVYLAARVLALGGFAPHAGRESFGPLTAILSAFQLFGSYLVTLVVPVHLSALHAFRAPHGVLDVGPLLGFALAAGVVVASMMARQRSLVLAAWGLLVCPLLPALYLPALGEGLFAERYLYLPVLGFGVLVACAAVVLIDAVPRARVPLGVTLAVAGVLGIAASAARARVWHDNLSLWTDVAARQPANAISHESLCFALLEAGRPADAVQSCGRALAIDPQRIDARTNLGIAYLALGRLDEAAVQLEAVVARDPRAYQALTQLGLLRFAQGRPQEGLAAYREALRIAPEYAEAHNDLGVGLMRLGQREAALDSLRRAVQLAPGNPEYRQNLEFAERR